jgi:hypothetical protein
MGAGTIGWRRLAGSDWLHAGLVTVLLLALYAASAPRSVASANDGLFVLSSYFLGVGPPPGYPLYTLSGYLFAHLPLGGVAYRVHLLSALFGAASCGALWLLARRLLGERLPAYLAALGLGLSPAFWSQAVVAAPFTLNMLFLLVLLHLAFAAAPPQGAPAGRSTLPLLAFLLGLGMANHYPLMLLVAPGLGIALSPVAAEARRRAPLLGGLFLLGLLPYVWLLVRAGAPLPVSFYGPLESPGEMLRFLAPAPAPEVHATAGALDRLNYLVFFWTEFFIQFGVAGSLLALAGFAAQWQVAGKRIAWALTAVFLGPSIVLLMLLGFDYDGLHKDLFRAWPLPAYGIAALWMALGLVWARERLRVGAGAAAAACAAVLGLTLVFGAYSNTEDPSEWLDGYGVTLLEGLPRDAVLIAGGEWDLVPLAYLQLVEGRRPDLTLVHPRGLVLGNRVAHPLRVDKGAMKEALRSQAGAERGVVAVSAFAEADFTDYPRRDYWLYQVLDKSPGAAAPALPESFARFFERSVLGQRTGSQWAAALQGELRRKYGRFLARAFVPGKGLDAKADREMEWLANDYYGALGLVEGLLSNPRGYTPVQAMGYLGRVRQLMPSDAPKADTARYFELRAYLRAGQQDARGTLEDLDAAVSFWPVPENSAVRALDEHYRAAGDQAARAALQARLKQ